MIKYYISPKLRELRIRWTVILASKYETYEKVLSYMYDPGPYTVHFDKGCKELKNVVMKSQASNYHHLK